MNTFEFSTCSSLVCGIGAIDELPSRLKSLGVTKALIVTDPGLLSTGIVAQACDSLAASDMPFTLKCRKLPLFYACHPLPDCSDYLASIRRIWGT